MSLEHAILGFLNYRPLSGYDLKKVFDTSVRHFWPADQAQIYRTLSRLAEKGMAEIEVIAQDDRPARKVYHITDRGKAELQNWLRSPLPMEENRSAPLVQVFFAGQLSDEEVLAIFERTTAHMRAGLEQYQQIPQQAEAYTDYVQSPREFFFWMLTLEVGIHHARSNLEFLENLIDRIRKGELPPK